MRIVIDMQGAQTDSRFRGIGRYTLSLTQAIVRNRGEHEIILALSGLFPDTIEPLRIAFDELLPPENIRVWYSPGPVCECEPENKWRHEVAQRIREAFLASLRPDVVHITSLFEGFADEAVTSIGIFDRQCPTAVTLYDLIPLLNPDTYLKHSPAYGQYYLRKVEDLKLASQWLAISESSAIEGREALALPTDAVVNISTACDAVFRRLEIAESEKQRLFAQVGITRPFILYSGGSDPRKNLHRLIRAYAGLPMSLRDAHQLVLAGKMPAEEIANLRHTAKSTGIGECQLLFAGYVTDDELAFFYNLCAVFVLPSLHEGFGLPALEAMSCGAAVIGANTTSIPEVIARQEALFDPHDEMAISRKLAQVLGDADFRAELAAHGLQQARKFSWDESARRAIAAFEALHSSKTYISTMDDSKDLLPDLVRTVAEVVPTNIPDAELLRLAHALSRISTNDAPKQLLVDVSELAQSDSRTVAQHVTHNILKALLERPPEGYVVEPVYTTPGTPGYLYARHFDACSRNVCCDFNDDAIDWRPGDVFLCLDLQPAKVLSQKEYLSLLRRDGVSVSFVLYDPPPGLTPQVGNADLNVGDMARLEELMIFEGIVCTSQSAADQISEWQRISNPQRVRPLKISWFPLGTKHEDPLTWEQSTWQLLKQILPQRQPSTTTE